MFALTTSGLSDLTTFQKSNVMSASVGTRTQFASKVKLVGFIINSPIG